MPLDTTQTTRLLIPQECEYELCRREFTNNQYGGRKQTFCSAKCYHASQKGKKSPAISEGQRKSLKFQQANKIKAEKRRGQKHSEETKRKMSESAKGANNASRRLEIRAKISKTLTGRKYPERSGENASNWKGGITDINVQIRRSDQYKAWRTAVFERDSYTCTSCGDRSGQGHSVILQADHIKLYSLYPELRFDINNGQTLCYSCHRTKTAEDIKMLRSMNPNWGKKVEA